MIELTKKQKIFVVKEMIKKVKEHDHFLCNLTKEIIFDMLNEKYPREYDRIKILFPEFVEAIIIIGKEKHENFEFGYAVWSNNEKKEKITFLKNLLKQLK